MSILIKKDEDFAKLVKAYNESLKYIKYLESKLDAAVYQEEEFNKKFTEKEYADENSLQVK